MTWVVLDYVEFQHDQDSNMIGQALGFVSFSSASLAQSNKRYNMYSLSMKYIEVGSIASLSRLFRLDWSGSSSLIT